MSAFKFGLFYTAKTANDTITKLLTPLKH